MKRNKTRFEVRDLEKNNKEKQKRKKKTVLQKFSRNSLFKSLDVNVMLKEIFFFFFNSLFLPSE